MTWHYVMRHDRILAHAHQYGRVWAVLNNYNELEVFLRLSGEVGTPLWGRLLSYLPIGANFSTQEAIARLRVPFAHLQ